MPYRLTCECGSRPKAPDRLKGRHVQCGRCGRQLYVDPDCYESPEREPTVRGTCRCGKELKAPLEQAAEKGRCPRCKRQVRITRLPDATVSTPGGGGETTAPSDWGATALLDAFPGEESETDSTASGEEGSVSTVHEEEADAAESLERIEARAERIRAQLEKEQAAPDAGPQETLLPTFARAARDYGRLMTWGLGMLSELAAERWQRFRDRPGPLWRRLLPERGFRAALNEHPIAALTGVGLIVLFSIVFALGSVRPAPAKDEGVEKRSAFYYDLNTGEVFVAQEQPPPIPAPSGPTEKGHPAGVRAHVFACGDCGKPDRRFVGYISTLPRGVKEGLQKLQAGASKSKVEIGKKDIEAWRKGPVIRPIHVDTKKWVPRDSEAGKKLRKLMRKRCEKQDAPLLRCYPADRTG